MNNRAKYYAPLADYEEIKVLFHIGHLPRSIQKVADKILNHQRLTPEDGLILYEQAELSTLALLADHKNHVTNQNKVYFNRNIHIEPTNICIYNCRFCSYSRKAGDPESWVMTPEDIKNKIVQYKDSRITEVHMVGGVHPNWGVDHYKKMIEVIKETLPHVIIKAYTAVEIDYISKREGLTVKDILSSLKESGLRAMPGGGAEIFNEQIRKQLCPDKCQTENWLHIHKTAHQLEIPTNATMLYGHIENYQDRIDHMERLRNLQDKTGGFNAFIPLKYRIHNNSLSLKKEVSVIEDLKNYAVARLFLDNFQHIKAYWPMIGRQVAQLSLSFGVDDLDGTIDDTTRIYSMAGAEEQKPSMNLSEITELIKASNKIPVERDTFYNVLQTY